jgi:hypothetical protein
MTDHEDRCNWDAGSDGKAECLDHGVMFELRPEVPVFASGSAYFVGPAAAPQNRVTTPQLRIRSLVVWQHPTNPSKDNYATVRHIGPRFVTVGDSVGSEGILPEWIVMIDGVSVVRTDADALRDTRNHHQGSGVVHAADADHARDLRRKGLIGPRGGLTRRGSIAAEQLRNAALDDAFGPL